MNPMPRRALLAAAAVACSVLAYQPAANAAKPTKKQLKVNLYVEILNQWSPFMYDGRAGYAKWVDFKGGPTCSERGLRAPGGLGDSAEKRFSGYVKQLKKGPKLAADAAALDAVGALQDIREPITQASDYYHKRRFKDDGCKLGKALHPKLVAAWARFAQAEPKLRAFVVRYNDERLIKSLDKTRKKYGKGYRYHHEKIIIDGKTLIRIIDSKQPDIAAIKQSLAAYVATLASVTALVEKAKGDLASMLYQGQYKLFVTKAGWFKDAAEQLIKALEEPADKRGRDKRIERELKQAFKSYNGMIDGANAVRYHKKVK